MNKSCNYPRVQHPSPLRFPPKFQGLLAQLVERRIVYPNVRGSNPLGAATSSDSSAVEQCPYKAKVRGSIPCLRTTSVFTVSVNQPRLNMKQTHTKRKPSIPRNPFVAAALFRQAGAHRKSEKSQRRHNKIQTGLVARRSSMWLLTTRSGFDSQRVHHAESIQNTFAFVCALTFSSIRPVSSADRATVFYTAGRAFESPHGVPHPA